MGSLHGRMKSRRGARWETGQERGRQGRRTRRSRAVREHVAGRRAVSEAMFVAQGAGRSSGRAMEKSGEWTGRKKWLEPVQSRG